MANTNMIIKKFAKTKISLTNFSIGLDKKKQKDLMYPLKTCKL